ncbi:unnamed protein product [Adineta steineri]|uniref:Uncharacterized protein n=1 Tax=Adineta steineri TaxID=433720 RepID=A0A815NYX3_9BILA|nr:unnamed protein product [Adineta steineri]CAF1441432.1 unnamed protein product [Adineta steineri]CAF1442486.1 unnamed protein product [Adineta steineri]
MQFVKVFDNHKKAIVKLVVNEHSKINYNYFRRTFPDAVGLIEMNESGCFSIPFDKDDNFVWNWNDNVVYDLIYSDPRNDRLFASTSSPQPPPPTPTASHTTTTTTFKDKIWTWMGVTGGLFSSTKPLDQYKKFN